MQRATARRDGIFLVFTADHLTNGTLHRYLGRRWDLEIAPAPEDAYRAVARKARLAAAVIAADGDNVVGLALLDFIRRRRPALPVLVLGDGRDSKALNQIQRQRAEFACKPNVIENVRAFARRVVLEASRVDETIRRHIDALAERYRLSLREAELLALAVADHSRSETSERMGITENTYKTEARSLLKKTGRKNVAELASELRATVRRGL